MTNLSQENETIQKLITELDEKLSNCSNSPFSESAFSRLCEKINEYILQLIDESFNIAKRHKSDIISEAYVEQASNYLVSNKKSKYSGIIGTFGGVFLGFFLTLAYNMFSTNEFPALTVAIAITALIIAAIIIGIQFNFD